MKQIFRKQEVKKLKKLIDEGASITAEDFQRKMNDVKRKICKLFDSQDQNEEEE